MRKLLPAFVCATALVATSLPAQADSYHYYYGKPHGYYGHGYKPYKHFKRHHYGHRHHRHRHHRHYRHGGDIGDEILLGAGIIGGSIIVGSVLSQPRRAPPPPPVYYAPPPQPYCVQDQVYRYLPDGSIQWGTRTRCY